MSTEDVLRAALSADAGRFAPSPGAWAENQRRVRRRTRARRATLAAVTAAAVGATGAVAVAWPRPGDGQRAVSPAAPSASGGPSAPRAFTPPDLHGMAPADAEALGQRCLAAVGEEPPSDGEVREHPGGLVAPPEDYRLIFVLPKAAQRKAVAGDRVALHANGQVVTCETVEAAPGITHDARLVPGWLKHPAETWGSGWNHGAWGAYGAYTNAVVRLEVQGAEGETPVPAVMDNGFWFAAGSGVAPRRSQVEARRRYPQVTGYDRDGNVVYRNTDVVTWLCYVLPDESVAGPDGEPVETPDANGCGRTYRWP